MLLCKDIQCQRTSNETGYKVSKTVPETPQCRHSVAVVIQTVAMIEIISSSLLDNFCVQLIYEPVRHMYDPWMEAHVGFSANSGFLSSAAWANGFETSHERRNLRASGALFANCNTGTVGFSTCAVRRLMANDDLAWVEGASLKLHTQSDCQLEASSTYVGRPLPSRAALLLAGNVRYAVRLWFGIITCAVLPAIANQGRSSGYVLRLSSCFKVGLLITINNESWLYNYYVSGCVRSYVQCISACGRAYHRACVRAVDITARFNALVE